MRIVERFKVGEIIGYMVEDEGLSYPVTERGLYDEDILRGLSEAGYKIMNYHGDIITPDGVSIKDIMLTNCPADEQQIQTMLDMAEYVLSEADATKYFCRDVSIQTIDLKEPKVEIKTREELIEYLRKCKLQSSIKAVIPDVRPLNSFVAKEALFTIEEYISDAEVRKYFDIIEDRRKLASLEDLKRLVAFLQEEGVLSETYNAGDIKEAYLAWGICGLRTAIVDRRTEYGVGTSIYEMAEGLAALGNNAGSVGEVGLQDKLGTIYTSKGSVNLKGCSDFGNEPIRPVDESFYWENDRKSSKWKAEYSPIKCYVPKNITRTYLRMLTEDGISFRVRVDASKLVILDSRRPVLAQDFLTIRCVDNTYVSIELAETEDMFIRFNLARAKAREMVRQRTIQPPVSDSFHLCVNEGVTPMNAVNYIARKIKEEGDPTDRISSDINYADAAAMYKLGPEKSLIQKYNPNDIEYDNIDELISIMLSTRDDMIQEGTYLMVGKDERGEYANQIRDELATRPLEKLEFVKSAKEGLIAIGALGAGIAADGQVSLDSVAKLLLLACDIYFEGRTVSIEEFSSIMSRIETLGIFDPESVLRTRDAAYHGYLLDRATLNAERASQCSVATYVTKVYREISNAPIEEQRHYMFESIALDFYPRKRSKAAGAQNVITEAIRNAVDTTGMDDFAKKLLKIEAPSIAIKLMFKSVLKKVNSRKGTNADFVISEDINVGEEMYTLNISIPEDTFYLISSPSLYATNKLCTLCDWCELEMTSQAWNFYCLNADITPWRVVPKAGNAFPEYNFCVNYISKAAFESTSENYRNRIAGERARVNDISTNYMTYALVQDDPASLLMEYNESNIDSVLDPMAVETVDNYYKRFNYHNVAARKNGQYLKFMRLRSDVVFNNWRDDTSIVDIDESNDIYDDLGPDIMQSKAFLALTMPTSVKMRAIAMNAGVTNELSRFNIESADYDAVCAWLPLIRGSYIPYGAVIIVGKQFIIITPKGKKVIDWTTVRQDVMNTLASKGIVYQLNARAYLIPTTAGNYCLEVK